MMVVLYLCWKRSLTVLPVSFLQAIILNEVKVSEFCVFVTILIFSPVNLYKHFIQLSLIVASKGCN